MKPCIPHPSTNPGCFLSCELRRVYDVEEEMLKASENGQRFKVKWMEFKYGITVVSILRERLKYYQQFEPSGGEVEMSLGEFTFPNQVEYNKARDIYLEMLERDDALPKQPDLTMLIREEYVEELRKRVREAAIEHEETNRLT